MKRLLAIPLAFICALLMACAQVGLPTPQAPNERIAVAQASVTQMRSTATQLLQAKKITSSDAENVLRQTDTANEGLSLARTMLASDPPGADSKLQSATAVLQALQIYLASKGKP